MPDILMPSLGADMDAGTLIEWQVAPGDRVERGAIVALVETEKATMEIESFVAGVVDELLITPGTKVPVGTVLARLRGGAEDGATPSPPATPAPPPTSAAPATPAPSRIRSSPAARRRARELGLELAAIAPTGPSGAVVLRDVEAARAAAPTPAPAAPPPSAAAPPPSAAAPPRLRPPVSVTGPVRDAIAAAMSRSKREIPHFYLSHTISMQRALTWLADENARRPLAERLLPGALLLKAVVDALWQVPELSGFWIDGAYRASEAIHLGTAISLRTGGVIAPAILDADEKPLDQLMAEMRDLVVRARAGRLRSTEMTSATITVTSLGDRGCEVVWGVINPPQVAIIGFGAIVERPWVEAGQVSVHPVITATLAADHRVCDGHRGGLLLSAIDHLLQEPEKL
jgi:pyruvate dehydrogenase E2 component (dihydrolipoamide acetyltransferase)